MKNELNGIVLLEDEVLEGSLLEMIKGGCLIEEDCACGTGNTNKGNGSCTCGGGNSNVNLMPQGAEVLFG